MKVEGVRADDARRFAEKVASALGLEGFKLLVKSAAPVHVGLGSTTQLALAVSAALAKLRGAALDPLEASRLLGRGARSGIGTYAFKAGGFIVDGGRGPHTVFPPLIARYDFPEDWAFLVVIPKGRGLHGGAEAEAFRALRPPSELVFKACHLALMKLIPSLLEHDLEGFAQSLTKLQETVGSMFSEAQGGVYNEASREALEVLKSLGLKGVGQSSWGPTVYAVIELDRAPELLDDARSSLPKADVFIARGDNVGAKVEVENE